MIFCKFFALQRRGEGLRLYESLVGARKIFLYNFCPDGFSTRDHFCRIGGKRRKIFRKNISLGAQLKSWTTRSLGLRKCRVTGGFRKTGSKPRTSDHSQKLNGSKYLLGWNGGVKDDKVIRFSLRLRISGWSGNYRFLANGRQISSIFEIEPSLLDSLIQKNFLFLLTNRFEPKKRFFAF